MIIEYVLMFAMELIKYWLVFKVFCSAKIKNKAAVAAGLGIYVILFYTMELREVEKRLLVYLIIWIMQFIVIQIKEKRNLSIVAVTVFGVVCVDELMDDLVESICLAMGNLRLSENNLIIISDVIILAVVGVIYCGKKVFKLKKEKIIHVLEKYIEIVLFIVGLEIAMTIAGLSYVKTIISDRLFYMFSTGVCIVSFGGLIALVILIMYIRKTNDEMKKNVEMERNLRNAQKNYYEILLEKEEETRKYRHDTINHLLCMKELAISENAVRLEQYIDSMQKNMMIIQKKNYSTGNHLLDVLLNHYVNQMDDSVDVTINGLCSQTIPIDEVDLCTIFGNLFQNAVEALNRMDAGEKRYFHIQLKQDAEYFKCQIKNSREKDSPKTDADGIPLTTKNDSKNHGIGLLNVKKTIEKNEGLFDIKITDCEFVCTICLEMRPFNELCDR